MADLARGSSSARLLSRWLDEPDLVRVVQELDAPTMRALIEHVGLEDAGEIVALLTTEQLEGIFDEDLWRTVRPTDDPTFDAERFGSWLAVLFEADPERAVETIAEMDEELLTLGLSLHVLVIDLDALAAEMAEDRSDDHDLLEKALDGALYEELEEFRIISRRPHSWDVVAQLLVSLDRDHHPLLRRLLERCCAITAGFVEDNGGLYDVLTAGEMLTSDVAAARADRREERGFVAPSDARSFLRAARATPREEILASNEVDPITRAHFRAAPARTPAVAKPSPRAEGFLRQLRASGALPASPRPLLSSTARSAPSRLRTTMRRHHESSPSDASRRTSELAYLVNVLMAGCSFEGRALRPIEAAEIVEAVCSLGLAEVGADESLVKAFRVGWNRVGNEERWSKQHLARVRKKAR